LIIGLHHVSKGVLRNGTMKIGYGSEYSWWCDWW